MGWWKQRGLLLVIQTITADIFSCECCVLGSTEKIILTERNEEPNYSDFYRES